MTGCKLAGLVMRVFAALLVALLPVPVAVYAYLVTGWLALPAGPDGQRVLHSFPYEGMIETWGWLAFSWSLASALILAICVFRVLRRSS